MMSEATRAASQLGGPGQRAARHPKGRGPAEQSATEEGLVWCFLLMEQNWKEAAGLFLQEGCGVPLGVT